MPTRFGHPALLYRDAESFAKGTASFLREGLARGEMAFVVARGDLLEGVRDELGSLEAVVRWEDCREWHPHHASRLRAFHELVRGAPEGTAFRLVGEPVWPDRPEQVREWQRYESALNAVLAPFPVTLLCLYDAGSLDPEILEGAARTHPEVWGQEAAGDFEEPESFLRRTAPEGSPVPASATVVEAAHDLLAARGLVMERAVSAGVDAETAVALGIAVNELLTNALVHGGGPGRLSLWTEGRRFLCQVEDQGPGLDDPLAGYRPPGGGQGGRGLWLARQLVDLLEILPSERGTTIRVSVPIA